MRISKLMLPAVTVAGALALAGCGGGSSTPAGSGGGGDDKFCPAPNQTLTYTDSVDECPSSTGGSSGTPLTGDALAEAKALQSALSGIPNNLFVGTDGSIISNAVGKKGTPVKADDDPWKTSTVAPAVGGGWTVKGYERTTDAGDQNIVSYSRGETYVDESLSAWITRIGIDSDIPSVTNEDGTLTLPNGDDENYSADFFPTGFKAQDLDDGELKGTFVGLAGTFMCTGECAATRSDDGDAPTITLAGTWTFELDGDHARLKVPAKYSKAPNPKFMTFGYWWSEGEDGEGDPLVNIDYFANGEAPSTALPGTSSIVSASYSGKASGAYVREVLDGSERTPAAAGLFTADVTLSAVFAATDNTVQGSIHDFMDGSTPISDWKLTLQAASADGGTGQFTGTAGGTGSSGRYTGQFYGGGASDAPVGAAGVFNSGSAFANGRAAGAFGATIDED